MGAENSASSLAYLFRAFAGGRKVLLEDDID